MSDVTLACTSTILCGTRVSHSCHMYVSALSILFRYRLIQYIVYKCLFCDLTGCVPQQFHLCWLLGFCRSANVQHFDTYNRKLVWPKFYKFFNYVFLRSFTNDNSSQILMQFLNFWSLLTSASFVWIYDRSQARKNRFASVTLLLTTSIFQRRADPIQIQPLKLGALSADELKVNKHKFMSSSESTNVIESSAKATFPDGTFTFKYVPSTKYALRITQ